MDSSSVISRLLSAPMRPGVVSWIGVRPVRREPLSVVASVLLDPDFGTDGDHYHSRTTRKRQVTLIQAEHLAAIAASLGLETIAPDLIRRNIVTTGINLRALKDRRFTLGEAVLEMTGECHPCSRMETIFGPGGYNTVRGHGGITARVVSGGVVRLGDAIARLDEVEA
ncbi:MAG: MOSC domain-containing protein [Caulobacteraceae bacterium]